jgi:hypothetical protein
MKIIRWIWFPNPLHLRHFAKPGRLGAFVLFALCGQWAGPKKITYASEPLPEEIIETSQQFLRPGPCCFWTVFGPVWTGLKHAKHRHLDENIVFSPWGGFWKCHSRPHDLVKWDIRLE